MYPEVDHSNGLNGTYDESKYTQKRYEPNSTSNGNGRLYHQEDGASDKTSSDGVEVISNEVKMEKSLGLISGTAIIAGTMIGSGIFVSPRGVLEGSGSVGMSLVVWFVCGVMAMLGALTYAELGTAIQKSGGEHSYLMEAFNPKRKTKCFGRVPAFLFDWICILIIRPSMFAIMCSTLGTYVTQPFYGDCEVPSYMKKTFTVLSMLLLCFINCMSIKCAEKIQVSMTIIKLFAAGIIMVGGIVSLAQGNTETMSSGFEDTGSDTSLIVLSFYNGLWAYDGWNNLNFVTEELQNPRKNIPRAICIAIPLVTLVYVVVNVGYFAVLTKNEILLADAVAVIWGQRMLGVMAWTVPVFVVCSCFGAGNGTLFASGRLSYVAARDGHLPSVLSFLHVKRFTPIPSMIYTVLIASLLVIPFDISSLIGIFSFTAWIFYGLTASTVLIFRYRNRGKTIDSYRVPILVPILVVVYSTYLVLIPLIYIPKPEYIYVLIFMAFGLCLYFMFVYSKFRIPLMYYVTKLIQLIFMVVPPVTEKDT